MDAFVEWINTELNQRGWSRSEAARRGGFSPSTLDKVIGGFSHPGPTLCRGLAKAFERPPDEVFRLADLLPARAASGRPVRDSRRIVYEVNTDEVLLARYHALRPEDQERVRDLIERLGQVEPRIIGEEEK
jgi:transcriptional regulator with XRE-family HTH domain